LFWRLQKMGIWVAEKVRVGGIGAIKFFCGSPLEKTPFLDPFSKTETENWKKFGFFLEVQTEKMMHHTHNHTSR